MRGAELILGKLSKLGVRDLHIVPGAHIDYLTSSLMAKTSPVKPVFCTAELSAGYMSDGYARANRGLGVIAVNGGPGFHGLTTALKVALTESTPLLVISGDAPAGKYAQHTFQSSGEAGTDDFRLSQVLCKYTSRVHTSEQLPGAVDEAIRSALEKPCGPAHLIIPYDLFKNPVRDIEEKVPIRLQPAPSLPRIEPGLPALESAEPRIALLLGDPLWDDENRSIVHEIVRQQSIPVLTTYKAKGAISERDPLCFGNVGFAPSATAVNILKNGDIHTLVTVDVDWNERNTAGWHPELWRDKNIINFVTVPHLISRDEKVVLFPDLSALFGPKALYNSQQVTSRKSWLKSLNDLRVDLPLNVDTDDGTLGGAEAVSILSSRLPSNTNVVVDAGSIRIYVGSYWQFTEPRRLYTSDIIASMGWGIAAGIGIASADRTPTIVLTGDGSMLMQGTDLVTAAVHHLPIVFIVFDNATYASVESRILPLCEPSTEGIPIGHTNWVAFSESCGVTAILVKDALALKDALTTVMSSLKAQPATIVVASPRKPVFPMPEMSRSFFGGSDNK